MSEADYFRVGREIHADLAAVAEGSTYSEMLARIPPPPTNQIKLEEWTRRLAWIACVIQFVEPWTREAYHNLRIEGPLALTRDPLTIRCIPDRLLEHKLTKKLVYREYKSAKWFSGTWAAHWPTAIQQHIGLKAIEEEFGRQCMGQVMGLLKGDFKYGRLNHPYVYAFRTAKGEWTPKYAYAHERVPVWEYPDGIDAWVQKCGSEVASKVITWSEPIYCDDRLLDILVRRVDMRMHEIQHMTPFARKHHDVREEIFPQRFERCRPSIGSPCPFLAACHNHTVNTDPVGSGLYVKRTPIELEIGDI